MRSGIVLGLRLPLNWLVTAMAFGGLTWAATSSAGGDDFRPLPPTYGPAGSLRTVGHYPYQVNGFTVASTTGTGVLIYGVNRFVWDTKKDLPTRLRERDPANSSSPYYTEPLLWDPSAKGWRKVPQSPACAYYPFLSSSTTLADGKVLFAGGTCDVPNLHRGPEALRGFRELSLWDPSAEKWLPAPSLHDQRVFHTATLLKDGSVLLAGGEDDPAASPADAPVRASVEEYREGAVNQLPPLATARAMHTATELLNGNVLIVGGMDRDGRALAAVEIWDTSSRTWSAAAKLHTARYNHTATLLEDGRVMVAGGVSIDGEPIASVEMFDPASQSWLQADPLLLSLRGHAATVLANGDVLVVGGMTVQSQPSFMAMVFAHASQQWRPAGFMQTGLEQPNDSPFVQLIPDSDGGAHVFAARVILQWQPLNTNASDVSLYAERVQETVTVLKDGRVLIAGGQFHGAFVDWAEIYDPDTNRFVATGRMRQPRSWHTAVATDDGGVVVAGGWAKSSTESMHGVANSPEFWSPTTGRWKIIDGIRFEWQDWVHVSKLSDGRILFLASRELSETQPEGPVQYAAWIWDPRSGAVQRKSVSATPRARAAFAMLPNDRLLIAAGYVRRYVAAQPCPPSSSIKSPQSATHDEESEDEACTDTPAQWVEEPTTSVETWDTGSGAVAELPPLPITNSRDLKSLVLRSGDVIIFDSKRPSPYGGQDQTEVVKWSMREHAWVKLPRLRMDSSWPMTELLSGTLITERAWLVMPSLIWLDAPLAVHDSPRILQMPSGAVLSLSMKPPHVAVLSEQEKQWRLQSARNTPPLWNIDPAVVALDGGRAMFIGQVETGAGASQTASIWNSAQDYWSDAGRLARRYDIRSQATRLGSGAVLHLGFSDGKLICELWDSSLSASDAWKFCGTISSQQKPTGFDFALATLSDGRGAMYASNNEVQIFDQEKLTWLRATAEFNSKQLQFGAPVRSEQPLLRILDPRTNQWIEANVLGTRYLEMETVESRLLWNPKRQHWDYVFHSFVDRMGRHAAHLSDGCAMAWSPLTLFNPATAEVRPLPDPGTGVRDVLGQLVVLDNDEVVIAGPRDGAAPGFFHRKASCSGFEEQAGDDALMPGVTAKTNSVAPPVVAKAPAIGPSVTQSVRNYLAQHPKLPWAIGIPIVLFFAISLGRMGLRRGLNAGGEVASRLNREIVPSVPMRWVLSIMLYGCLVLFILYVIKSQYGFNRFEHENNCVTRASECVDSKTGLLEDAPTPDGTSVIPCRFVGVWSSIRPQGVIRITLSDDGRFTTGRQHNGSDNRIYTGYWSVQGNKMVWRQNQGITGLDVNPIVDEAEGKFVLVEMNGTRTRFELVERVASKTCSP